MTSAEANTPTPTGLAPDPGQALGTGAAGIALFAIEQARQGNGDWAAVHQWVTAMTRRPVTAHPDNCGLFHGAPAVAFVLRAAGHPSYSGALGDLDRHIEAMTRQRLDRAHDRIDRQQLPALREFDLIGGLTGIGAYLLHRQGDTALLREVLAYLVRLTEPIAIDGEPRPGWWTHHAPNDRPSSHWPGGHANLGMAHGIAGPLALLSIALRNNITVNGQADAINRICHWLDRWKQGTNDRPWWPGTLTLTEWTHGPVSQQGPQRPSWCYGTPGLARAQQLAGLAIEDTNRQRLAEAAMASCLLDADQLAQIGDASLCHGWAGVLQTTWRMALDASTGSDLEALTVRVLAEMEDHLRPDDVGTEPGLLEGRAGIDLVRLTTARDQPPASRWDACLLIDGGPPPI